MEGAQQIGDSTRWAERKRAIRELLPFLHQLDKLLEGAVAEANQADSAEGRSHILEPGTLFSEGGRIPLPSEVVAPGSRLAWLQETFALSNFDLDVIAIALAPELDRRYEGLYAILQDDVRCTQPTVDLALNLLCTKAGEKLRRRDRFSPDAPLITKRLLHLVWDSSQHAPTLLGRNLQLDEQVVHFLLEENSLDRRLISFCQLEQPTVTLKELHLKASIKQALGQRCLEARQTQQPLRLYFQGSDRAGKRRCAEAIGGSLQVPLLRGDLARVAAGKADIVEYLELMVTEAMFKNALLFLERADILQDPEREIYYEEMLEAIGRWGGITILAGSSPWHPGAARKLSMVTIAFDIPEYSMRRREWEEGLNKIGISIPEAELDRLSDRFRLNGEQIADAIATANQTMGWQKAVSQKGGWGEMLFTAARAQTGRGLAGLARKILPKYNWEDIVLPADPLAQLREICNQAKHQHLVWEEWGFGSKLSLGKGLNVLFSGPPGTGKTMAAEVIAGELQLDLYKIDLSQIVSKYIGETEKNLNRIFTAAANSNAILLFDEADALFGKRTEVKDAHDRYANIEVGYLLQKMEEYEGLAILTTNNRSNMDDAFVRRLRFIIEFPLPKEKQRREIWEKVWPEATPRSEDLDNDFLARKFELTGANIRNIALGAAFLAARDNSSVGMKHAIGALRREYQKMGKLLMEKELR